MIITLKIHRNEDGIYTPTGDLITLQFGDFIPVRGDKIRSEEGQTYRVMGREWLPGGVVLDVVQIAEEIVEGERAA